MLRQHNDARTPAISTGSDFGGQIHFQLGRDARNIGMGPGSHKEIAVPQGRPGRGRIIVLLMSLGLFRRARYACRAGRPVRGLRRTPFGFRARRLPAHLADPEPHPHWRDSAKPSDEHTQAKAFAADLLTGNGERQRCTPEPPRGTNRRAAARVAASRIPARCR